MAYIKTRTPVPSYVNSDAVQGITIRADQEPGVGLDGPTMVNTGKFYVVALLSGGLQLGLELCGSEDDVRGVMQAWAELLGREGNGK